MSLENKDATIETDPPTQDAPVEETAAEKSAGEKEEDEEPVEVQMIDLKIEDSPKDEPIEIIEAPKDETPADETKGKSHTHVVDTKSKRKIRTPDGVGASILRKIECIFSKTPPKRNVYEFKVKTREFRESSTDDDVFISILGPDNSRSDDLFLDKMFRDDLEMGHEDRFVFSKLPHIEPHGLELWKKGSNAWFCEYIYLTHTECALDEPCKDFGVMKPYPCHQWLEKNQKYHLYLYNSQLPQDDSIPGRKLCREEEMKRKKVDFEYGDITGLPRRVKSLPLNEQFDPEYHGDLKVMKKKLFVEKKVQEWFHPHKWDTFEDLINVYRQTFHIPRGWENWKSDENFGDQRLNGLNTAMLRRCDNIPSNFPVTDAMVGEFMEGLTLAECIQQKRLFICNLHFMEGMPTDQDMEMAVPIALFFSNSEGFLMPLAIQLFQEPSETNPIFLPSDDEYVWLLAKMYYNNADSNTHQSTCHLGFTHFIGESICVAANQCLAAAHPVYQLLAPHFLFLLAINNAGIRVLMEPGGFFDKVLTIGRKGFDELLARRWKHWRLDVDGWLPNDIETRGLDDKDILRHYYFRDDALLVHGAIVEYVRDVLSMVYDNPDKLTQDEEIQEFARVLVDEKDGAGMKGVFGNGKFEDLEDLVKVVSATIYLCSVSHAAANFGQYDEYAFPPNYPGKLRGEVLKDKTPRAESDIIAKLPNKEETLTTMLIMTLLSGKNTNSLGFFEIQFLYEPRFVEAVERFQKSLEKVGEQIEERNKTAKRPYPYLHPKEIPNAISI